MQAYLHVNMSYHITIYLVPLNLWSCTKYLAKIDVYGSVTVTKWAQFSKHKTKNFICVYVMASYSNNTNINVSCGRMSPSDLCIIERYNVSMFESFMEELCCYSDNYWIFSLKQPQQFHVLIQHPKILKYGSSFLKGQFLTSL